MKKVLAFCLSLFLALTVFAEGLTREEALQYARRFFSDTPNAQLNIVWTGDESEVPAFYAINRTGGGFLILSGESVVNPVIGYSYDGSFTTKDMPEHVQSWFRGLERDIFAVREMHLAPEMKVVRAWEELGVRTKGEGTSLVLESAQWDQGAPYNKYCPTSNGRKAVTGCVATAMAITMRYNKYPAHGYGSLKSYTTSSTKTFIEGFSIEDHEYKWDLMPLTNVSRASDEAKDQIAQLMYDCGVMVQMNYSPSGSGAVSMYMPAMLAEHMGYSAEAMLFQKSMYKPKEWIALVKKELDANRLVFYSAQDANGNGGHAFVIDGYDENNLLHVNWGWSGSGNAFFDLDMEVDGYRFANSHGAVLGLVPDPDHSREALTYLALTNTGLSLASGKIMEGKTFTVSFSNITNYGNGKFNGPVKVVLTDENDKVKADLSSPQNIEVDALSAISGSISNCKLETVPAFKDRVQMAYRNPKTGEFEVMRADVENESVGGLATVPNFIAGKNSYSAGETFEFKLFKSGERFTSATWYFDGELVPVEQDDVVLTAGLHEVKVVLTKGGGTETLVRELNVR